MAKGSFGLRKNESASKETRSYELSPYQWSYLFDACYEVVKNGGAFMMYTSSDGNALCVSIKHGKDGRKYWIGPDDDPTNKLAQIMDEWGLGQMKSPLEELVAKEVDKMIAVLKAEDSL